MNISADEALQTANDPNPPVGDDEAEPLEDDHYPDDDDYEDIPDDEL